MKNQILKIIFLTITLLIVNSCSLLKTALYDQYTYENVTSLKVESLHLMSSANSPFSDFKNEVDKLKIDLEKLSEYEKNKSNNEITYEMINLIKNADKNLLGGFLKRWEDKNKLSESFIEESKYQVQEAFDLLIKYELNKDKDSISNYIKQN